MPQHSISCRCSKVAPGIYPERKALNRREKVFFSGLFYDTFIKILLTSDFSLSLSYPSRHKGTSGNISQPRGIFLSLCMFISWPWPTTPASKMRPQLRKTFPRFPFVYFGNLGKTQIRGQKFVIEKKQNNTLFQKGLLNRNYAVKP